MIAPLKNASPRRQISACKALFLTMLPAIARQARLAFRHFSAEAKQEAVQNVLANTWAALVALARRGKLDLAYPSVLAGYGIKQTLDHRIVGAKLNVKDPLSRYCQVRKGVKVTSIDHFDEEEGCWREAVVEDTRTATVPEIVAFRCDFADWLQHLRRRDRRVAEFLALGHRTSDAARKFKVSEGRVSQVRGELRAAWLEFIGEPAKSTRIA